MSEDHKYFDTGQKTIAKDIASASEKENKPMERIIEGYSQGYTRAMLDLIDHMPFVLDDMKRCKAKINKNSVMAMMKLFCEHRHDLRDGRGFMRWNNGRGELEWYIRGDGDDRS